MKVRINKWEEDGLYAPYYAEHTQGTGWTKYFEIDGDKVLLVGHTKKECKEVVRVFCKKQIEFVEEFLK